MRFTPTTCCLTTVDHKGNSIYCSDQETFKFTAVIPSNQLVLAIRMALDVFVNSLYELYDLSLGHYTYHLQMSFSDWSTSADILEMVDMCNPREL